MVCVGELSHCLVYIMYVPLQYQGSCKERFEWESSHHVVCNLPLQDQESLIQSHGGLLAGLARKPATG